MENAKQTQAQELSAQELADVAGGVYKPDIGYETDGSGPYDAIAGDVAESLEQSGLPYYPGKKPGYSDNYTKTETTETSAS